MAGGQTIDDATAGAGEPNFRQGIELRVRLSTLLGLDRFPAQVAGWGHTHAGNARRIVAGNTGAEWRYAVCDDDGTLLFDGLITARPADHPRRTPVRGGIIEIQIRLSLLRELHDHPDRFPAWTRIVHQIVTGISARSGGDGIGDPPAPPGGPPGSGERDRRFPTAGLRRRVQMRDRQCAFVGCRMPAATTDTDHIRQWIDHGPTQDHNLVSLCRHDHLLKDRHGWRLHHTADGKLRWTSPTGLTHLVPRPPIMIALPCITGRAATTIDPATEHSDRPHRAEPGSGHGDDDTTWCDDQRTSAPSAGDPTTATPATGGDRGDGGADDEPPPF